MTDCQNEALYYPTVDPVRMGPDSDLLAAIPYLREFRLSTPHVIYQPPTTLDLQAAGAIPVEHMSESNNTLPTITLSAEIASYRGSFREVLDTVTSRFLCPPEREGAEAISEELQRDGHDTSDQEYWSEEYWKSLQTEELGSAGSMVTDSGFQSLRETNLRSTKAASAMSSNRRRRRIARRKCDFSNVGHRRGDREELHGVCPPQRSSHENFSSVSSWVRGHPSPGTSSRGGVGTSGDYEGRLGLQDVSSLIQPSRNVGAATKVRSKTKHPRHAKRRVMGALRAKGPRDKDRGSVGSADAFSVYPPGLKNDSLLLNASGTGHLDMSTPSSRGGAEGEEANAKAVKKRRFSDAHKARVSVSGGEIPRHSYPVKFTPTVKRASLTAPSLPPAAHGVQNTRKQTLVSASSSSNIHHRDGGGGVGTTTTTNNNNKNTKKKISVTSGNGTTASRHNSGDFVSVEAPHVEMSQQVLSYSQRKDLGASGPPIDADISTEGPAHPKPLLGVGKQASGRCCMVM